METLTRAGLAEAVWREMGLPRREAERFVEAAIGEMVAALAAGEKVTIVNFGSFATRPKEPRMGRNPKTGESAPIAARRAVAFRPSKSLKVGVNERVSESTGDG